MNFTQSNESAHNPTGVDLNHEQWKELSVLVKVRIELGKMKA
jgi:aspartate/tyrosine/aromatic aminotransferase